MYLVTHLYRPSQFCRRWTVTTNGFYLREYLYLANLTLQQGNRDRILHMKRLFFYVFLTPAPIDWCSFMESERQRCEIGWQSNNQRYIITKIYRGESVCLLENIFISNIILSGKFLLHTLLDIMLHKRKESFREKTNTRLRCWKKLI